MSQPELIAAAPPKVPVMPVAEAAPAPVAPAVAPSPAPAAPEPAPAPVVEQATPVVETAKPQTLLGEDAPAPAEAPKPDATTPPEAAPPEKALDGTVKPEEVVQDGSKSDEPAPLPTYDAFTLPEGVALDSDRIGNFTKLLGEYETGAKDHAATQALGQQLVDFHVSEIQQATQRVGEYYQAAWDKQKVDWKDDFMKDPDIGGNRFQTTLDNANRFIRTHVGSEDEQVAFRKLLEDSGLGSHKVMIKALARAGSAMKEGVPLAAPAPAQGPKSKVNAMYGTNK